jgi:hypothetical protein
MWHRPYLGMSQQAIYALQTAQGINTKTLYTKECPLNFKNLIPFIGFFILAGCQVVPKESENHLLVLMNDKASYIYDSIEYDAKSLSKKLKTDFMSGVVDTRKIEIHCLKYMKFTTFIDFAIFPKYGIKLIKTKNYVLKSEGSTNEVELINNTVS